MIRTHQKKTKEIAKKGINCSHLQMIFHVNLDKYFKKKHERYNNPFFNSSIEDNQNYTTHFSTGRPTMIININAPT